MSWYFHPLQRGSYDVVVIDVPSHFGVWSDNGAGKSPQAYYETMGLDEIIALPAMQLLKPGGTLFYWATWPTLVRGDPIDVFRAWGVQPSTGGAWVKRTRTGRLAVGTGFIWRSVCEPILVGCKRTQGSKRGSRLRGPSTNNLVETFSEFAFDGLRRGHSRKPEEFYALVEKLTPGQRRADIFSRASRSGWDTWGRERTKFDPQKLETTDAKPSRNPRAVRDVAA